MNDNFAKLSGYPRDKALGLNHRTFVDPDYAQSNEYREFWNRLRAGERIVQVSKRISASGEEMWTEAAYNPISASTVAS